MSRVICGSRCRLRRVSERPFQGVVGDFLPAFLRGEKVRPEEREQRSGLGLATGARSVCAGNEERPAGAARDDGALRKSEDDLDRRF